MRIDRSLRLRARWALTAVLLAALAGPVALAAAEPPLASFTLSPATPRAGEVVTFTSTSTDADGTIALEEWDLNDDAAFDDAIGSSAERSFAVAGSYTVRLRVTDDTGATATTSAAVEVVANQPPSASFTVSPVAPKVARQVTFTSTSSDPDGSIASQAWDLDGDGAFDDGTGTSATRTFSPAGSYGVSLRVTDNLGVSAATTTIVQVADNWPPNPSFGYSPSAPIPSQTVTFTSMSTDPDGTITALAWDLDDDGAFDDATGTTATRAYATAGPHVVRLRATDNDGAVAVAARTVTVNQPPVAAFTVSALPKAGRPVTFTSASTDADGTIATHSWDTDNDGQFDDGAGTTAQRTFANPGTYTVRLRVTDDRGAANIASQQVTVTTNVLPSAAFDWAPAVPVPGQAVTFTSTSTDSDGTIAALAWDLDDDGQFDDGTQPTATHAFATAGAHTMRLRATDNDGATAEAATTITVNARPAAAFTVSGVLKTGRSLTITSTSTDADGSIVAKAWDLDEDGQFDDATGTSAQAVYWTAGTHVVGLRVTDDDGASDVATRSVEVADNQPPVAAFGVAPAAPAAGEKVTFTSASSDPDGSIAALAWDLDDDGQFDDGSAASASRVYPAGNHVVRVRATDDDGASHVAVATVPVGGPPTAGFTYAPAAPVTGEPVAFTSTSTDPNGSIVAEEWDFDGDGAFDDAAGHVVQATFSAGDHVVALRVIDNDAVAAIAFQTVTVAPPPAPLEPPATGAAPGTLAPPGPAPAPAPPAAPAPVGRAVAPAPAMLSPFPIVRVSGRTMRWGSFIDLLEVRGPAHVSVVVRCRGRGCPRRARLARTVPARGRLRFPQMHRALGAGAVVEVLVRSDRRMGKYTRFTIRRGRPPLRRDLCLPPGRQRPAACPSAR